MTELHYNEIIQTLTEKIMDLKDDLVIRDNDNIALRNELDSMTKRYYSSQALIDSQGAWPSS